MSSNNAYRPHLGQHRHSSPCLMAIPILGKRHSNLMVLSASFAFSKDHSQANWFSTQPEVTRYWLSSMLQIWLGWTLMKCQMGTKLKMRCNILKQFISMEQEVESESEKEEVTRRYWEKGEEWRNRKMGRNLEEGAYSHQSPGWMCPRPTEVQGGQSVSVGSRGPHFHPALLPASSGTCAIM